MAIDKRMHFAAGLLVAIAVGLVFVAPEYGLAAALFAGLMKEVRDWCVYQGFDAKDMLATWLGGVAGYIIITGVATWKF